MRLSLKPQSDITLVDHMNLKVLLRGELECKGHFWQSNPSEET